MQECHTGGFHPDADFTGAGLGRRPLPLLHDFRTAVTGDDDFAHARDLGELRMIDQGVGDWGLGIGDSGVRGRG